MEAENKISKAKRKLIALVLIYSGIAFALIGFVAFQVFSEKKKEASENGKEVIDLSAPASEGEVEEGQYVRLEIAALPKAMLPVMENVGIFYYVTDVNNHIYIANLSNETMKGIIDTLDAGSGELNSAYQFQGMICKLTEPIKKIAISNSVMAFGNNKINLDNFSEYFDEFYIKDGVTGKGSTISKSTVTLYVALVLCGVLFLIVAFGHIVPGLISLNRGEFGVMDEKVMWQALQKHLPEGETLEAGICGAGLQTNVRQVFGKCVLAGERLIADENGTTLRVSKSKYARFGVYIGISWNYLILSECETYKHYYEIDSVPEPVEGAVEEIDTELRLEDIGTCFPLAEIQNCEFKNSWTGAVRCSITMKNGSFLKLGLPKQGGLGMPEHAKYREVLIKRLRTCSTGNR